MTETLKPNLPAVTLNSNGASATIPYQVARNALQEAAYAVASKALGYPVAALQVTEDCEIPVYRALSYPEQEDFDRPYLLATEYPLMNEDVRRIAGWEAECLFNFPHFDVDDEWDCERMQVCEKPAPASIAEVILELYRAPLGVIFFQLAKDMQISKNDLTELLKPVQCVKKNRLYDLVEADFQKGVEELKAYRKVKAKLQRYKEILGGCNAK